MATKANCWEVKACGREPGGRKVSELGACPACQGSNTGHNGGCHGGRICWAIAGTLCGGKAQGSFAQKAATCTACDFFQRVRREEGAGFKVLPLN